MKTRLLLFLLAGFMISCGNDSKKNQPEVKTVESETQIHKPGDLRVKFKEPIAEAVYKKYIQLKSDLVNSDAEAARRSAKELANQLEKVELPNDMRETAMKIAEIDDIEAQREVFQYLTKEMIPYVKGKFAGEIYVQYCPMAFNNQGAYWLSNTKEIRNPYFGDKMLKCGEVTDVIK